MPKYYVQTATISDYVIADNYMQAAKQVVPNVKLEDLAPAEANTIGYNILVLGQRCSQHYLRIVDDMPPVLLPVTYFDFVNLFGVCNSFILTDQRVFQYDPTEEEVWNSFTLHEFRAGMAKVTVPKTALENHFNWLITEELPKAGYDGDIINILSVTDIPGWWSVLVRAYQMGTIKEIPQIVTTYLAGFLSEFIPLDPILFKNNVNTRATKTEEIAIMQYVHRL